VNRGDSLLGRSGSEIRSRAVAVCHQVTTIDRAKLTKRIGALSGETLRAVESGLKAAMDRD
jgi:mRNA-degrading endonuclease toxin of MazEF toxin-antitoxin module